MFTRSYRPVEPQTPAAPLSWPTGTHARLILQLPEPPSINEMLDMAKERVRRGRKIVPRYWLEQQQYKQQAVTALLIARVPRPVEPWARWSIVEAHFALHALRDRVELFAGLKWPVDLLVSLGFVTQDSPRELLITCQPTQVIARTARGVRLTIQRED